MKKKFAIVLALFLIAVVCSAGCIDPEDPVDPIDPVDPVDPVDPITPVDPVDPVVPTEEYSVMFMLNYGDAGAYTAETVKAGETVSKPASPTRSGYTFNGWFTAAEGGAAYDFTQPVNADVTLYAQWKKKSSGSSHSHSYTGAVTTSPTCGVAGVKTYTCGCGASYTEPIPATGQHKLDSSVPGKITCTVCGFETLVASEAVALVGDTTYTTFNDAVAAAKGGKTIILLKDGISATITENVIIGGNDKSAAFTYTNVADIHILKANWTAGNTVSLSGKTVVFEDASDDAGLLVVQYAFDNNKYDVYTENGLVSVFARLSPDSIINLTSNLDMTGKTVDAIDGNTGFRFNGYGYTISNLVGSEQGLFVHHSGSSDYYFYNVHLKDCSVISTTNYAGLFVGDADTCDELVIKDCTVTDCTVESGKYAAAFVAYTAGYDVQNNGPVYSNVTIENCTVTGGSITGGGSTAVAIGHAGGNPDTDNIINRLTVSNVVINGEDAIHTGIAVGTAHVGKTYITDVTYNGVTGNYNTAHPLYGRFEHGTTGKLVIDGAYHVYSDSTLQQVLGYDEENLVVNLVNDITLQGDTSTKYGGSTTQTITINGDSHTLTYSDSYRTYIQMTNLDGKLVLNDLTVSHDRTGTHTHWHDVLMKFFCNVEMTDVTFDKGICIEDVTAKLTDVTINSDLNTYSLWIVTGSDVTITDSVITATGTDGRAIKISYEDADSSKLTKLSVSGTQFTSPKKAAILAYVEDGGAEITLSNIDISGVSADSINAVWVDEASAAHYDKVTVTGGTKIHEPTVVSSKDELQSAIDADKRFIKLAADITGDVTVTQKPDIKITIDGGNHKFAGYILVDGKSARYDTAALTIKNINFDAAALSADAFINLGASGNDNTRYTNHVTVKDCTFTDTDGGKTIVAIKSYTGGDKNLVLEGCTVKDGMHSLLQVTNVEEGLKITGCNVYSKNGINLNSCPSLEMSGCTFDVKGYAVRFGVSGSTVNGIFEIKDSSLKSANDDGDAVIIFRGTMTGSTLTLINTNLVGSPDITGNANVVRN